MTHYKAYKPVEVWQQDQQIADLWHGKKGIIVNSDALKEREFYFEILRVPSTALSVMNSFPALSASQ